MKTLLTAAAVLDAADLIVEEVEVPEWPNPGTTEPGIIRLKQMDAERSAAFTKEVNEHGDDGMFIILAFSAVDEQDNLIFTIDDIARLRKKNFRVLSRLQDICLRINKMRPADETNRKNV